MTDLLTRLEALASIPRPSYVRIDNSDILRLVRVARAAKQMMRPGAIIPVNEIRHFPQIDELRAALAELTAQ
jgi:hypothetical protein